MDIPSGDTSFKALMDYGKITDKTSMQWEIQQHAYTDDCGLRRLPKDPENIDIENDMFLVAMAGYYTEECGARFRITLDRPISYLNNKRTFDVLVGEIKNPDETDNKDMYHPSYDESGILVSKNVLEFIIDEEVIDDYVLHITGDVSDLGFEGNITKIEKYITD